MSSKSRTRSQIRNKVAEVKPAVAEMGKRAEAVGNDIKSAIKEVNVEEKMEEVKKAVTESAAKVAVKVAEVTGDTETEIYVQYGNGEADTKELIQRAKAAYVEAGNSACDIKSVQLYIKPEDNAAYYVINKKSAGQIELF